jgi:hypothetical protein
MNFVYKKTTQTSMKIAGIIDTDTMTVDVDGDVKQLNTLLSDFNGGCVEINVKKNLMNQLLIPVMMSRELVLDCSI